MLFLNISLGCFLYLNVYYYVNVIKVYIWTCFFFFFYRSKISSSICIKKIFSRRRATSVDHCWSQRHLPFANIRLPNKSATEKFLLFLPFTKIPYTIRKVLYKKFSSETNSGKLVCRLEPNNIKKKKNNAHTSYIRSESKNIYINSNENKKQQNTSMYIYVKYYKRL